jgi:hypothetical protein
MTESVLAAGTIGMRMRNVRIEYDVGVAVGMNGSGIEQHF